MRVFKEKHGWRVRSPEFTVLVEKSGFFKIRKENKNTWKIFAQKPKVQRINFRAFVLEDGEKKLLFYFNDTLKWCDFERCEKCGIPLVHNGLQMQGVAKRLKTKKPLCLLCSLEE